MNHSDNLSSKAAIFSGKSSFKEVIDQTFERLWDKKVELSIRRIRELEERLNALEMELDMMIKGDRS
ncbi:MAG: hypothetical protein LBK63_08225 [Treponema sp.]|jgi:hypothetical protein|nr:hypothetical protein [Treponema sp.]